MRSRARHPLGTLLLAATAWPTAAWTVAAWTMAACSSGARIPLDDVPPPRAATAEEEVGRLVGRLLSADPERSRAAEEDLRRLDERGNEALLAHARKVPNERDPRWWSVLDERGLLRRVPRPPTEEEFLDFLLWKAARPDRTLALAAQSALLEAARRDPAPLARRLERPGPGRDVLAVTLAGAGVSSAVPAILALYRSESATAEERRAAAAALGVLLGEDARPRAEGTPEERERDARFAEERWRTMPASPASAPSEAPVGDDGRPR